MSNQRIDRSARAVTAIVLALLATFVADVRANAQDYPTHESATRYLGNHPNKAEPPWSDQLQGLASDRDRHWFVTQKSWIWRIPAAWDLDYTSWALQPSISWRGISDLAPLDHFGDPDYWKGHLLVPMEGGTCGTIGVFRGDDPALPLVASACIPGQANKAPWVAVGPDGVVYTSRFDVLLAQDETPGQPTGINRYTVDWSKLSQPEPELVLMPLPPLKPVDSAGRPMAIPHVQGGVLSPSGRLLFLSSDEEGLLVFRIEADRLVLLERSCNDAPSSSCRFSFQWDNSSPLIHGFEQEPEGLEYWDLNDGRAQGIRGELHVAMVDVEAGVDDLYIKHYTAIQWVDSAATTTGNGKIGSPYRSLLSALAASWPGSIVRARGSHPLPSGTVLNPRQVRLEAWDAAVRIGDEKTP